MKLIGTGWRGDRRSRPGRVRILRTSAAALALSVVVGCGSGGASTNTGGGASDDEITVVNGITSFEFLAADFAEELGTWDKVGLKVNYIHGTGGGGQVTTTLTAGQADIGLHGGAAAAISIAKGQPGKIIAVTANSFAGMVCVVGKDSGINSFADLKGKTMGISSAGSLTDLVAQMIAKRNGWKFGTDFKAAKIGDLSQLTAALEKGVVDIICWSAEPAMTLVEKGQGKILGNAGDVVGPNIYEAIVATDNAIKNKPEAIKKYLRGYFTVVKYMKDHPDETIKFLMKQQSLSENVAKQVYEMGIDNESLDGSATEEQLAGVAADVALMAGIDEPATEKFWDGQFVPVTLS